MGEKRVAPDRRFGAARVSAAPTWRSSDSEDDMERPGAVAARPASSASFLAAILAVAGACFAGVLFGPDLLAGGRNQGQSLVPAPELVAGLDREAARAALAAGAFPDPDGSAAMARLATDFPADHADLLERLADVALAGGDRDALTQATMEWSDRFVRTHLHHIADSDARSFDTLLDLLSRMLRLAQDADGGCKPSDVARIAGEGDALFTARSYGTPHYAFNMQALEFLTGLARSGRDAPKNYPDSSSKDAAALKLAFGPLLEDAQVRKVMTAGGNVSALPESLNVCTVGQVMIRRARNLPQQTKDRFWGDLLARTLVRRTP